MDENMKWYVIHTYSGYENKVKINLENVIESRNMKEMIPEVLVPMHDVIENKNGKKKVTSRKVFPGYVIVRMVMNDDTWYVVRNIRGVTGFVGPGSKPVALTQEEIRKMGISAAEFEIDLEVDDVVEIISGPFKDSTGTINEVNSQKRTVVVMISVFGRETPVELDVNQVNKI